MTAAEEAGRSRSWVPAAVALALLAVVLRLLGGVWPIDDAFITFRYARNLATGLGLVYNPDQFVLGTSTPLFTLLLAALAKISGGDIPRLAVGLSAIADGVTTFLLYRLGRRLKLPTALCVLCGLTWAFYPLSLKYALGGMETSLMSALLVGAFLAWQSGRDDLAMALAGAAVLCRPDALAAAFTIGIGIAAVRRALPARPLLAFAAVVVPWLIFATALYGNPLPQSVRAKSHRIYQVPPLENTRQIAFHVGGLALGSPIGLAAEGLVLSPSPRMKKSLFLAAAALFLLWLIGASSAIRGDRRWIAFFAFPVVFAGAYAFIGLHGGLLAEWYLVPLTPFWLIGIFAGLLVLSSRLSRRWTYLPFAVGALIAIAQAAGLNWRRDPTRSPWVPLAISTGREEQYRQAADFLKTRLRPGEVLAASEIGAIGYYCDCQILDTVGLISPEAVRYYPLHPWQYVLNYAVPPNLIRDAAPDYVVSLDVFVSASLLKDEWFKRNYRVAWSLESTVFGGRQLLVFARERGRTAIGERDLEGRRAHSVPETQAGQSTAHWRGSLPAHPESVYTPQTPRLN